MPCGAILIHSLLITLLPLLFCVTTIGHPFAIAGLRGMRRLARRRRLRALQTVAPILVASVLMAFVAVPIRGLLAMSALGASFRPPIVAASQPPMVLCIPSFPLLMLL